MTRLLKTLIQAYLAAKARRELYALSDKQLRDIGLRREQIEFIRLS